eukprot:358094-Chlamydomonas_euryale.AAC.2
MLRPGFAMCWDPKDLSIAGGPCSDQRLRVRGRGVQASEHRVQGSAYMVRGTGFEVRPCGSRRRVFL